MSRRVWIDTGLWDDLGEASNHAKLLWFYLLTSPLSNQAGFYKLNLRYLAIDLGSEFKDLLLEPTDLYIYDKDTELVLIPNYLKYNVAKSPQQLRGVANSVRSNSMCPLWVDYMFALNKYCGKDSLTYYDERILKQVKILAEGGKYTNPKSTVVYELLNDLI